MVIVIDNYDSFTYNLVQFLGELGADIEVHRNDKVSLEQIRDLKPDHLVVSPGPGTPQEDSGVSNEVINDLRPGYSCTGSLSRQPMHRPRLWRRSQGCSPDHAW